MNSHYLHFCRKILKPFLLVLFWIICFFSQSQQNYIRFNYITNEKGLSQNSGRNIIQDNYGFMWFGTEIGLNKYDGTNITVYKYNPLEKNSITNNYINTIFNDSKGNIIIGTDGGGLNYFDTKTNLILPLRYNSLDSNTMSDDIVLAICQDKYGFLWVGTSNGLNKVDLKTKKVKRYFKENNQNSLISNVIRALCTDNFGNIWIGTPDGLCKFNLHENKFTKYLNSPKRINTLKIDKNNHLWISSFSNGISEFDINQNCFVDNKKFSFTIKKLCNNNIFNFEIDEASNLWIATTDSGLIYYNKQKELIYRYKHELYLPNSLPSNQLRYVYLDKAGVLWVGTFTNGICYYDTKQKLFNYFPSDNSRKFFFNSANAIMQDRKGNIWLGLPTGLIKYNIDSNICEKLVHNPYNLQSIPDNSITKIIEDKDGVIWVATNNAGVFTINPNNNNINTHFTNNAEINNEIKKISAWELFQDNLGNIWIGSWDNGVYQYQKETKQFIHFYVDKNQKNSISSNSIICINQDKNGIFWFGTWEGGINSYNKKNNTFSAYKHDNNNINSLALNIILDIYIDQEGILWIGTFGAGLDRFDPKKNKFTHFTEKDGLADNNIFGIIEDAHQNLWITTNKGICKFNKKSKKFRNYNITDGVQGNEFSQHGSYKCRNGNILFSGINGFNYFCPDSIKDNQYLPPVLITDFKIFNRSVLPQDSTFLSLPIFLTKEIILSYREAVFSFDFNAFHYAFPEKINYYYKMENFDEEWINAGNNRTAKYTNLKAGTYFFKVKASNCDGIVNPKETSIKIIITPPFWETFWFYSLVVLFVISLFYFFLKLRLYKLKKDKKLLEIKVIERTTEINKQKEEILTKNKTLEQQKEEILTQRDEIELQRNDIAHKNNNITASINYAQRIQQAILPDETLISQLLSKSFVFYKPKDIVSGDFYWISANDFPNEQIIFIAAVDCTGHGVPGALMSMMSHNVLKKAINEQKLKHPDEILQSISKEINILLRQKDKNKAVKDSMDIALLAFNKKKLLIEYAGVHNPLYLITNNELIHIKADNTPIGEDISSKFKSYTNHQIKLKSKDVFYIFSDGFIDQYGSTERKKYMSKQFKAFLLSIHQLSMNEQKQKLEQEFERWKGNYEQIDDVLIIGIEA